MFNGIIYNVGSIINIKRLKKSCYIEIKTNLNLGRSEIGSSINTNGVCLTITKIYKKSILFFLSKETLDRSNFKKIKLYDKINLEKSLSYGKRISGHYVQGHVDTTGRIRKISVIDKAWFISIKVDSKHCIHLVEKASISLNGVSLTIAKVKKNIFEISIIPHTLKLTNLINLKKNDIVNIEFDIFSKYIINLNK
jgi:riboflavin synthase